MDINVYWAEKTDVKSFTHEINRYGGVISFARCNFEHHDTLNVLFHGPDDAYRAVCYKALLDIFVKYPGSNLAFYSFPEEWW